MSEVNNTQSTNETNETLFVLGRNLIAVHPWFMGLGSGAVVTALSHFYYGNKAVTTVAWAFAGIVGGVALSKIAAHAREIEMAAQAALALPANIVAIGAVLESKIAAQTALLNALKAENAALKGSFEVEAETQHGFRHWVGNEMEEARKHRAWEVAQTAEAKAMAAKAVAEFDTVIKKIAVVAPAVVAPKVAVPAAPAAPVVAPVVKAPAPVVVETAPAVEVAPAVGDKVIRKQPKAVVAAV